MIDRATVDRILDAVKIEEVIGDFVSLRRRGTNYLGLCPFHQDKNPSMSVSATKGIFKCFACVKAGTAVSFIMEHEHLTYPEALRYLANKYHIEIVEKEESAEEIASRMRHESLVVVSEYAQKFYQDILWNNDYGKAIGLSYFRERKFTDETIRKFGLGYAHNRPLTLASDALKKGYKKEYLVGTGLCIERENGDIVDRFYDRVMFPIHSLSGRVIAFGGRTLRTDKSVAKYVNSPETEIYNKSRSLYGLYFAKNAIIKQDKCILVEGYADVISMHQSGIENVVASSGTSLTVEQIRLIKRFTENVTIIYDGDEAGIKASLRGIDLVLEEGLHVKVVLLPPEDDPDSYAKAHTTEEILDYIAEHEKDFIAYKSDILARDMEGDPLRKSQLINDIIQSVAVIPDPILRSVYVETVSERFGQKVDVVLQRISEIREKKKHFDRMRQRNTYMPRNDGGASVPPAIPEDYVPQMPEYLQDMPDEFPPELPPALQDDMQPKDRQKKYAITNVYLATQEKELLYYLIRYGSYPLHFEEDMLYGAARREEICADEYIKASLFDDDLIFDNELYREVYDAYFAYTATLEAGVSCEDRQRKIVRYFTTHENQAISTLCLELICEDHPLTVKEYTKAIVPEEQVLGIVVPKSVILYKSRITEQMCTALAGQIIAAQKSGDKELQRRLVEQLQTLNQVKNRFAKELNRL